MIYEMKCEACGQIDERYIRLAVYEKEIGRQKREACDGRMVQVITPARLQGLTAGPGVQAQNNDGCCDDFTRTAVERNLGHKLGGAMFVPGCVGPASSSTRRPSAQVVTRS